MSTEINAIEEKLKKLEKGLYFISEDCERALSNHESVALIEDLRVVVGEVLEDLGKL